MGLEWLRMAELEGPYSGAAAGSNAIAATVAPHKPCSRPYAWPSTRTHGMISARQWVVFGKPVVIRRAKQKVRRSSSRVLTEA